jgi:hypothetical protein
MIGLHEFGHLQRRAWRRVPLGRAKSRTPVHECGIDAQVTLMRLELALVLVDV